MNDPEFQVAFDEAKKASKRIIVKMQEELKTKDQATLALELFEAAIKQDLATLAVINTTLLLMMAEKEV